MIHTTHIADVAKLGCMDGSQPEHEDLMSMDQIATCSPAKMHLADLPRISSSLSTFCLFNQCKQ